MRVLVVDDEPEVRALICDALEAADLDCVEASSDLAAYDWLAAGERLSLLITDVDLGPGASGFDVARKARLEDPELPVLYVTATAGPQLDSQSVAGAKALLKPFEVGELVALAASMARRAH